MKTDKQLAGAIVANGGAKENRRALDFYPTPPEVTIALMEFLNLKNKLVWEPACGMGAMSQVIESYGLEVISTDINLECYGEGGVDFLGETVYDCDAIITPFNMSEQFIRKAVKVAPIVAMVLKSQYWHAAKRLKLFEDHPPAYVLPLTWRPDFLFDHRANGEKSAPTMDCIWTVWDCDLKSTVYEPLKKVAHRTC